MSAGSHNVPRLQTVLLAALAVGMAGVVYYPLVSVYFFADDFVCLFDVVNKGFLRFVVQPFGGHVLFVRNAVFWFSHLLFGFRAGPYYWAALGTHLFNVWLFFRVAHRFTESAVLACLGAALWGTSPLCVGTLGWYSVYGQVLVATILLFLLDRVDSRAAHPAPLPTPVAVGWYLLLLAGFSCFGTGIGVALAFPAVLFLLLPQAFRQRGVRTAFLGLVVLVPALYFGFQRLHALFVPVPLSEAILRSVALSEYRPIAAMLRHLIAFAITGVVQGFFFVPNDYPGRASEIVVPLYVAVLLAVLVGSDAATRRRILALVCLCVGVYALVAMGRSNVYLMFKVEPAASARQPRYHYVGIIPIALLLCMMVAQVTRWTGRRSLVSGLALASWIVVMGQAFVRFGFPIEQRASVKRYVQSSLQKIAAAIDAQPAGSDVYIENDEAPAYVLGPMLHHPEFPGLAGLFVLAYPSNDVRGRHVHFVERHPVVLGASRNPASNHRLAGLLVAPDGVDATAGTP